MAYSASPILLSPQLAASASASSSASSSSSSAAAAYCASPSCKLLRWAARPGFPDSKALQGPRPRRTHSMEKRLGVWAAVRSSSDPRKEQGQGGLGLGLGLGLQSAGPERKKLGFREEGEALIGRVSKAAMECLRALAKPAAMAMLVGLLIAQILPESSALAASGGVMGGRSFSSSGRAPSSSSSARTFSGPSSRNSFIFSAPYAAPSPFFGGGFGGPSIYVAPAYGIGGGGGFALLVLGFLAFFFLSGFLTDRSDSSSLFSSSTRKTSVLKLQVGLLGMARSLQQDLDNIAEQADTSTPEGLHYLLTETVLSLLRHPDYCISGYSSVDVKRNSELGEKVFNELSLEERAKFDEETIVNVNSRFRRSAAKSPSRFNNEYIVVTLLVAAEGEFKLPSINNNTDLKEALRKIGAIPKDQTLAVEVLWTPQDQNDTLSERELLRDYPLLRSL